jgi:hypothetical protein
VIAGASVHSDEEHGHGIGDASLLAQSQSISGPYRNVLREILREKE